MRMRSTGLGKTELVGQFDEVKLAGDYMVLSVRTTAPVKWHVRTALSRKDAIEMLKLVLKPRVLLFLVSSFAKREEGKAAIEY